MNAGIMVNNTLRLVDNRLYFLLSRNDLLDVSKHKPLTQLNFLDIRKESCTIDQFQNAYVVVIADGEESFTMKNRFE